MFLSINEDQFNTVKAFETKKYPFYYYAYFTIHYNHCNILLQTVKIVVQLVIEILMMKIAIETEIPWRELLSSKSMKQYLSSFSAGTSTLRESSKEKRDERINYQW